MSNKPNILFLMADQMQGRVFEPGHPCLTPNFDRLIRRGVRFTRAYTPNAVCSPARASLMTGLLPHNHGVLTVTHTVSEDQSRLRTEHPHWAQHLDAAGYRTGYFGKWHVEEHQPLSDFRWRTSAALGHGKFKSGLVGEKARSLRGDGAVTDARVGSHDLCPTLLELVGCDPIENTDSRSFAPVLKDPKPHEAGYTTDYAEYFGGRMILTQRVVWDGPWKFVFNGFDFDELYNLDEDPQELYNLAGQAAQAARLRAMTALMWKKIEETGDHSLARSSYPPLRVAPFGPGVMGSAG